MIHHKAQRAQSLGDKDFKPLRERGRRGNSGALGRERAAIAKFPGAVGKFSWIHDNLARLNDLYRPSIYEEAKQTISISAVFATFGSRIVR